MCEKTTEIWTSKDGELGERGVGGGLTKGKSQLAEFSHTEGKGEKNKSCQP